MDVEWEIVDPAQTSPEDMAAGRKLNRLVFQLNRTIPMTDEYAALIREIFGKNLGEDNYIAAPLSGACLNRVKIGNHVFINSNVLFMARGGITIEDGVQIAANVQLLTNNHDPYNKRLLPCKPILICEDAWIGAGATILPGVRIGKHAVVGAASIVTKDVPDYAVAVGNPAKIIKMLEPEKFSE